jgi:hypothetical protein
MSLLDRLRGTVPPKIPSHQFQAAMSEWADGATGFSRATIISGFKLTVDDETELDALKAIYDLANTDKKKARLLKVFDSIVMLAEDSRDTGFYSTKAQINARLNEAVS